MIFCAAFCAAGTVIPVADTDTRIIRYLLRRAAVIIPHKIRLRRLLEIAKAPTVLSYAYRQETGKNGSEIDGEGAQLSEVPKSMHCSGIRQ
jgi:hypothetical protein